MKVIGMLALLTILVVTGCSSKKLSHQDQMGSNVNAIMDVLNKVTDATSAEQQGRNYLKALLRRTQHLMSLDKAEFEKLAPQVVEDQKKIHEEIKRISSLPNSKKFFLDAVGNDDERALEMKFMERLAGTTEK